MNEEMREDSQWVELAHHAAQDTSLGGSNGVQVDFVGEYVDNLSCFPLHAPHPDVQDGSTKRPTGMDSNP